jgi:hypothetical protein
MTLQDAARLTSALAVHVRPAGKTPIEVPGSWVIIGSPWRAGRVRVRTGRHHRLLAVPRIGREVLPFLPLMRDAEQQVARPSVMNNLPAGLVLPDMRIHHQNGPSGAPARRQDNMTDAQAGRLRWRPRRRRDRGNARCAPGSGAAGLPAAYGRPVTGSVPRT